MEYIIDDFFTYLDEKQGASSNTLESYKTDLRQFIDFLHTNKISNIVDISKEIVHEYIHHLEQKKISNSTISRKISSLKSFYKFLEENAYIDADPTKDVKAPKIKRKLPNILTSEEVEQLLVQTQGNEYKVLRDRAMIYLMYGTGIRVSDLIQLDIDDIDLDNGIVLLKKRNNRSISIPEEILTYIKKYIIYSRPFMLGNNNEQALFVNFRGNRITRQGFWKIIKQYTEQANIRKRITPHTLRHSFAAHLINNGIETKELQNMLGHSDISTTQFYTALSNKK